MYLNLLPTIVTFGILTFNFNKSCIWILDKAVCISTTKRFNFNKSCIWIDYIRFYWWWEIYLTLTRVVFELIFDTDWFWSILKFNFNKSCIWIRKQHWYYFRLRRFNFNKSCIWITFKGQPMNCLFDLTLTRVVFELFIIEPFCNSFTNLTLTRVVFECSYF